MAKPEVTCTIEDFIKAGQSITISYQGLSLISDLGNKIKFPFLNVFNDYIKDIKESGIIKTALLTDSEVQKYIYKPKILAYDIYGKTDLNFLILALNNIGTPKEFTLKNKKVKLLSKQDANEILKYIYNAEKDLIDKYKNN
jgi:hypothetical protein